MASKQPMDELLTSREVQDLLKVDRTTIYRMLKDGRLTGVKVGDQWRFSREEIQLLLSTGTPQPERATTKAAEILPVHCIQPIQNVFAQIAEVGSVTTDPDGVPITELSNACRFCTLIMSTDAGRRACSESWRELAQQTERRPQFTYCHAGLQYARARIEVDGELAAMSIAGQFHATAPDPEKQSRQVRVLAEAYGIDPEELEQAADEVKVLDERKRTQLGGWLVTVAQTFEQIANERSELMTRLQRIAEMTTFTPRK